MAQSVLCLDVSVSPARLVVTRVDGKSVELLESHDVEVGEYFDAVVDSSINGAPIIDSETPPPPPSNALRDALSKVSAEWDNAVLIIPGKDYLSLNLSLPFVDRRKVGKILEFEIQDVVPFDVAEFILDYRLLGALGASSDVHVGLLPKKEIERILAKCKEGGFDPLCVTAPPMLLEAALILAPDYFASTSGFIWASKSGVGILVSINGKARSARLLRARENLSEFGPDDKKRLLQELKLSVASAERRYGAVLDKVYVFGDLLLAAELQQAIGRKIEAVKIKELVKNESEATSLASLGAIFGQDSEVPLLSNFRTGDFAFRPQLRFLLSGLLSLRPYLLAVILGFALLFGATHYLNNQKIDLMQGNLHAMMKTAIPSLQPINGQEISQVTGQITSIEEQLKELGSISKLSVLDSFLEISTDLPQSTDFSIHDFTIREDRIILKGSADKYATIEKLEEALKKKQGSTYCGDPEIRQDSTPGATRGFEITLKLC